MVTMAIDELKDKMNIMDNIRNISVIAHVDHGKTTLTDSLVASAGVIADKKAGTARYTDTRKDEQERCITIKSTAITLHKEFSERIIHEDGSCDILKHDTLVNLIDSPGHSDFSAEVSAALRVTDGAIVVVDVTKGLQAQTYTVVKQALQEQVAVILFLNKIDMIFSGNALKAGDIEAQETAYQKIASIITDFNIFLATNVDDTMPKEYRDRIQVSVMEGTVLFGSGKMCWAFGIDEAFEFVFRKQKPAEDAPNEKWKEWKVLKDRMKPKFWGENFVKTEQGETDGKSKTIWKTKPGPGFMRGFCRGIIDIIAKIYECTDKLDHDAVREYLPNLKQALPVDSKELSRFVMKEIFPIPDLLMSTISRKLPSPPRAQRYRASCLSQDPSVDGPTTQAIARCSKDGPLIGFCSKKSPQGKDLARASIMTLVRIFSGTLEQNTKVLVMNDSFVFGETEIDKKLVGVCSGVNIMVGKVTSSVTSMPCGNIVGVKGIDTYLPGPGTIVEYKDTIPNIFYPIKNMKYKFAPIVGCRVTPRDIIDFPKLVATSAILRKLDLTCRVETDDSGITIYGVGPLHVEILVQDLQEILGKAISVGKPIVRLAETVTDPQPKSGMAKSPNKHNRLTMTAHPLGAELVDYLESVDFKSVKYEYVREQEWELSYVSGQRSDSDPKPFNSDNIRRILHIEQGNLFYNASSGCQYIDDLKDGMTTGMIVGVQKGPLCGERVRGVQYSLTDVVCHSDSVHRNANQIGSASRNVILGSLFRAGLTLQEPMYCVIVNGPSNGETSVRAQMNKLSAIETDYERTDETVIKYRLSMYKSLDLQPVIMAATGGTWKVNLELDGYDLVDGDPFDATTECGKRVKEKRIENNLDPDNIRRESEYLDRL